MRKIQIKIATGNPNTPTKMTEVKTNSTRCWKECQTSGSLIPCCISSDVLSLIFHFIYGGTRNGLKHIYIFFLIWFNCSGWNKNTLYRKNRSSIVWHCPGNNQSAHHIQHPAFYLVFSGWCLCMARAGYKFLVKNKQEFCFWQPREQISHWRSIRQSRWKRLPVLEKERSVWLRGQWTPQPWGSRLGQECYLLRQSWEAELGADGIFGWAGSSASENSAGDSDWSGSRTKTGLNRENHS